MAHILARLRGVKVTDIQNILTAEASKHAEHGLYLKHIWQNTDDQNEVLFIFRTTDLNHAREFIETTHTKALKENPQANLPQMTFLEEK